MMIIIIASPALHAQHSLAPSGLYSRLPTRPSRQQRITPDAPGLDSNGQRKAGVVSRQTTGGPCFTTERAPGQWRGGPAPGAQVSVHGRQRLATRWHHWKNVFWALRQAGAVAARWLAEDGGWMGAGAMKGSPSSAGDAHSQARGRSID